jgi:UDP-N-acetylglucosamine 1-carboxyvinyltransferase
VEHRIIPDRIVASTYALAVASAGGRAEIKGIEPRHFSTVTDVLSEAGCDLDIGPDSLSIVCDRPLKAVRPIVTAPYPGFPTDAQPPLMAASLKFEGTTVFVENIFENRYRHISELLRMGADIRTEGRVALICGRKVLHGATVEATDLRGGAALTVAALGAQGESRVSGLKHIDRGYECLETALGNLGADIVRLE